MRIPDDFTPIQKCIVQAYIAHRSVPLAALATFHDRNSSYVREVIRKYKDFLRKEDERLHPAAHNTANEQRSVIVVALCSFPPPANPPGAASNG